MSFETLFCCRRSLLVMSVLSIVIFAVLNNLSAFQDGIALLAVKETRKTVLASDERDSIRSLPSNISDFRDTDFVPSTSWHEKEIVLPSKVLIVAFYYPWYEYDTGKWDKYGTQGHHPLLGRYGSNDTEVAAKHIDWAVDRGGIDVWAVSWWNVKNPDTQRFNDGMLHAKNIAKIKFCMVYEANGALRNRDFNSTETLSKFIADMTYFRDFYFSHSSYLRINGRPVVYLYITRSYVQFNSSMLDTIKTSVGEDILFIADEPYYNQQDRPEKARNGIRNGQPVFEAYTSYNMYQFVRAKEGEDAVGYMFREALPIYARWSRQTVFFPHVLPKYHDYREGHPKLLGDSKGLMTQLKTFACLPRPSWYNNEFPDLLFVTSFNEWFEGSTVEPDSEQEYGFTLLDTIKAFKESGVVKCRRDNIEV